jgi:PAS domain S-box-containing protein
MKHEEPLEGAAPPMARSAPARPRADDEPARTREAAEAQAELLRITLASIGDAVLTADADGKVLTLNLAAEALTGWTVEEARGRPIGEIFRVESEEARLPVENPAERALAEGRVVGLANHTVLVARDGTATPIDDTAAPIRDEQGRVHGAVVVFRSIVERRRAEHEMRRRGRSRRASPPSSSRRRTPSSRRRSTASSPPGTPGRGRCSGTRQRR